MTKNDYPTIRHCIHELELKRQFDQGRIDMLELINKKNPTENRLRDSKNATEALLDIIESRLSEIATKAFSVFGNEIEILTKMSLSPLEEYDAVSVKLGEY